MHKNQQHEEEEKSFPSSDSILQHLLKARIKNISKKFIKIKNPRIFVKLKDCQTILVFSPTLPVIKNAPSPILAKFRIITQYNIRLAQKRMKSELGKQKHGKNFECLSVSHRFTGS